MSVRAAWRLGNSLSLSARDQLTRSLFLSDLGHQWPSESRPMGERMPRMDREGKRMVGEFDSVNGLSLPQPQLSFSECPRQRFIANQIAASQGHPFLSQSL